MPKGEVAYRRYLDGDDEGLVSIIEDYRDALILFLCGVVGNVDAAEEIAEETFFILAAKRPRYSGKSSFKTWLYAIAKNTACKEIKRHLNKTELTDEVPYDASLEEAVIKGERERALAVALRRISPDYREVLHLVYLEEFSNGEAAKVMKKSKKQIENLLARAKGALRRELQKEGFTYENL